MADSSSTSSFAGAAVGAAVAPAPLLEPRDYAYKGLSKDERDKRYRVLRAKISDMRMHRGRCETLRRVEYHPTKMHGIELMEVSKEAKDKSVKRRKLDENGILVEVARRDSAYWVGHIRFNGSKKRADDFCRYVWAKKKCVGQPTHDEIAKLFYEWHNFELLLDLGLPIAEHSLVDPFATVPSSISVPAGDGDGDDDGSDDGDDEDEEDTSDEEEEEEEDEDSEYSSS